MEVKMMKVIENTKVKIRNSLIKFIQQDKLERYLHEYINSNIKSIKDDLRIRSSELDKKISFNKEDIEILHNTIRNVVSVGADIVPNSINGERSWAVVCIEGNYNVVKFIDLHGADYRRILDFLKNFEGSRMVIDAPKFTYFEDAFKMK
jgi:hypothetical protein